MKFVVDIPRGLLNGDTFFSQVIMPYEQDQDSIYVSSRMPYQRVLCTKISETEYSLVLEKKKYIYP